MLKIFIKTVSLYALDKNRPKKEEELYEIALKGLEPECYALKRPGIVLECLFI